MEWFVLLMIVVFVPTLSYMWLKVIEEREEVNRKSKALQKEMKQLRRAKKLENNDLFWLEFRPMVKGQWTTE